MDLNFDFGLANLVDNAVQIAIIILIAIAGTFISKWITPRIISARVVLKGKQPSDDGAKLDVSWGCPGKDGPIFGNDRCL